MTDIHTHIIPCVDDGAKSLDEALKLLELEKENGINRVILTPHMNKNSNNLDAIIEGYNTLKEKTDIELILGSEIYYYPEMVSDIENNKLLTINNTKTILVEFSTAVKTNISDIVYDLSIKGYKPIIAHIERYSYLELEEYNEIHKYAKIQVNTQSFENKEYKKILKYLLKNNLIDYIASDCHNIHNRSIDFSKVKKILTKYKIENELEI